MSNEDRHALLVIPCFNESKRIAPFLDSLHEVIGSDEHISLLIVEDGSGLEEQTQMQQLVEAKRAVWPHLRPLLCLDQNLGKGGAVYAGWSRHQDEEVLAFVDADGSCTAEEVQRLLHLALCPVPDTLHTAFFASRIKMLGNTVTRDFHRHLLGRVYATIVSEVLNIPVYDSQCGLKALPRAAFEKIKPMLTTMGFAFDVELLCALIDSGFPVRECPISWHETPGGKVRLLRDSWRMFRDVLAIRRHRRTWHIHLDSPIATP